MRPRLNPRCRLATALLCFAACQIAGQQLPQNQPTISSNGSAKEAAGFQLEITSPLAFAEWDTRRPKVKFEFKVRRPDAGRFAPLEQDGITATLDGRPVSIHEFTTPQMPPPVKVALVLDGSLSMARHQEQSADVVRRVEKLGAAKDAITDFLRELSPFDRVAVLYFDGTTHELYPAGRTAGAMKAIDAFAIDRDAGQYTALYDAAEYSVQYALKHSIAHVVFLTDGIDDTPDFNPYAIPVDEQQRYKLPREERIASSAQSGAGVRVHTIGIGDRNARLDDYRTRYEFVDVDTLERISRATGGASHYVDLPQLAERASHGDAAYREALKSSLTNILRAIRSTFEYQHQLSLYVGRDLLPADGRKRVLEVVCSLRGDAGTIQLPVQFTIDPGTRPQDAPGLVDQATHTPILIPIRPNPVPDPNPYDPFHDDPLTIGKVSGIYAALMMPLLALTGLPPLLRLAKSARQVRLAHSIVVVVPRESPLVGRECPQERDRLGRDFLIRAGDPVVVCPKCSTPHHLGCWHLFGERCGIRLCQHRLPIPAEVLSKHGVEAQAEAGSAR